MAVSNESSVPRGVVRRQCSSAREQASIRESGNSSHSFKTDSSNSVFVHTDGRHSIGEDSAADRLTPKLERRQVLGEGVPV